jgi:hypothetical protein
MAGFPDALFSRVFAVQCGLPLRHLDTQEFGPCSIELGYASVAVLGRRVPTIHE